MSHNGGKCQTLIFVTVKDMWDKCIKYTAPLPDTAIARRACHPVENYYLIPRNYLPSFKLLFASLNPNLDMNMGHFLNITQKNIPFRMWCIYPFISEAVMPIFWPQTNKTAKEFQIHLLTDFLFAHTWMKWLTGQSNFITSHSGFLRRKALHRRLYLSADCFSSAFICGMVWFGRCEIASSPRKTDRLYLWTMEPCLQLCHPHFLCPCPSLPFSVCICGNVYKSWNLCPCWKTWFAVYSPPLRNKARLSWCKSRDWCRLYQISKYRPQQ